MALRPAPGKLRLSPSPPDVVTGGVISHVIGDDTKGNMGDGTRWLTYEDMGAALGIATESAKRLAIRHKWPRRPGNDGRALVAVPEDRLQKAAQAGPGDTTGDVAEDNTPVERDGAAIGAAPIAGRGDACCL